MGFGTGGRVMKGLKYKTKFSTVVPKGLVGTCVDIVHIHGVCVYKLKFSNFEEVWFLARDLKLEQEEE